MNTRPLAIALTALTIGAGCGHPAATPRSETTASVSRPAPAPAPSPEAQPRGPEPVSPAPPAPIESPPPPDDTACIVHGDSAYVELTVSPPDAPAFDLDIHGPSQVQLGGKHDGLVTVLGPLYFSGQLRTRTSTRAAGSTAPMGWCIWNRVHFSAT